MPTLKGDLQPSFWRGYVRESMDASYNDHILPQIQIFTVSVHFKAHGYILHLLIFQLNGTLIGTNWIEHAHKWCSSLWCLLQRLMSIAPLFFLLKLRCWYGFRTPWRRPWRNEQNLFSDGNDLTFKGATTPSILTYGFLGSSLIPGRSYFNRMSSIKI